MVSYLVCWRTFAHFLISAHGNIRNSKSFPVATGSYSWTLPLCILTTQCFQDTPAGRLMVSQKLRSRSATVVVIVLLGKDTDSQPAEKTPDQSLGHIMNGKVKDISSVRLSVSAHVIVLATAQTNTGRLWAAKSKIRENVKLLLASMSHCCRPVCWN